MAPGLLYTTNRILSQIQSHHFQTSKEHQGREDWNIFLRFPPKLLSNAARYERKQLRTPPGKKQKDQEK